MRVLAVIPARMASTRLPRKPLREIAGRPLLAHVYEAVRSSPLLRAEDVVVATDAEEIAPLCRTSGWEFMLTSAGHRSGTERVNEVAGRIAADVYLNIQGDEPMTRPEHIAALLARRDELQSKIDAWHRENGAPAAVAMIVVQPGLALISMSVIRRSAARSASVSADWILAMR